MKKKTSQQKKIAPVSKLEAELISILMNHCGEHGHNEGAAETLNRIIAERDRANRNVVALEERHEDFKVEIFDMLQPVSNEQRIVFLGNDTIPGSNRKRTVTKLQIARRAGRLVTIEDEYIELKDRTLPIPKMRVLEDDRNDRRNGGRGSGINVH